MKKLGVYLVITLALVSALGGFSHLEKSFAQESTTPNKDAIVTAAINSISSVDGYTALDKTKRDNQITKLNKIADDYFKTIKAGTSYNKAAFDIYSSFRGVLLGAGTGNDQIIFVLQQRTIDTLITLYTPDNQVGVNGKTQADIDSRNASASKRNSETISDPTKGGDLPAGTCTMSPSFSFTSCIEDGVTWIIKNTLLQIAGFLVWVSANMLNLAIQYGILNFAAWAPDTLYPIWIIIRQITSLFIVFAGLWLGFMYIIGRDDHFKKYIPWVIIFALFVNFSYPLTRALTDVSNIISLNIYTSAVGADALTSEITPGLNPFSGKNTPGSMIMDRLGLQGLVASATAVGKDGAGFVNNIKTVPGALLAVIYVAYTAYIFLMATGIIAFRTGVLVFLIVASPLLFVDSVIPKLGEEAAKLRKMFFEQLAVAPVFMIMLALTLKFLEVFQNGPMKGTGVGINTAASSNSIAVFFNILMMLIMLHIMLKVTKSVGGSVAEVASNAMGKVGGFAIGAASGGAGLLARSTLGRGAAALRDSKWVTNNQGGILGRHAYNMSNSLSNSTWDMRNSGAVSKGMANAGMGMGTGGKVGYEQENKARIEDANARRDRIKTTN
jgi:hypothetical protein